MIRDLDVPITSSFLSLDLPPSLSLTNVTLPAGVTATGDWMSDMVLTFDPALEAYGSNVGLMAELELCLGTRIWTWSRCPSAAARITPRCPWSIPGSRATSRRCPDVDHLDSHRQRRPLLGAR